MPYASCSFSCQPAPSPRRSRPPEMMSTCAAIFATTAGWRYVFPSTMVPTRMRGTRAASALRVLHDSSMAPSRSFVLGMKWSVTQPMSHPVASMCRQRSSTPDQVWAPMLVNRPKRMSLSSSRVSRGGAARAPGAIVRRAGRSVKPRPRLDGRARARAVSRRHQILDFPREERMTYDIEIEDVEYLRHGDRPLLARLFKPRGSGPFPLVVELHGGAWCRGNRLNDSPINEPLAKSGVVVAALDFRMPPEAPYPASVADINYAIRLLKTRATALGSRPDLVGVLGTSSGAHQAILVGMRPHDRRYAAIPLPAGLPAADASVRCAVLCWPVIDTLARYLYVKKLNAGRPPYPDAATPVMHTLSLHDALPISMAEGNPVQALERGERVALPPVLYLQGTREDRKSTRLNSSHITRSYAVGCENEQELFEGESEGFIIRNPSSPAAVRAVDKIVEFVRKRIERQSTRLHSSHITRWHAVSAWSPRRPTPRRWPTSTTRSACSRRAPRLWAAVRIWSAFWAPPAGRTRRSWSGCDRTIGATRRSRSRRACRPPMPVCGVPSCAGPSSTRWRGTTTSRSSRREVHPTRRSWTACCPATISSGKPRRRWRRATRCRHWSVASGSRCPPCSTFKAPATRRIPARTSIGSLRATVRWGARSNWSCSRGRARGSSSGIRARRRPCGRWRRSWSSSASESGDVSATGRCARDGSRVICLARDAPGPLLATAAEVIDAAGNSAPVSDLPWSLPCQAQIPDARAPTSPRARPAAASARSRENTTTISRSGSRSSLSSRTIAHTCTSSSSERSHTPRPFKCSWIGASPNGGGVQGPRRPTDAVAIDARP